MAKGNEAERIRDSHHHNDVAISPTSAANPQGAPTAIDDTALHEDFALANDGLMKMPHSQRPNLQNDISFHPGKVHFYQAPQQRQAWGDSQVLPRVNWGDLFFDLFYVAAVYNVGNILQDSPTPLGVLYFVGTFFPIFDNWKEKLFYDSRFMLRDDVFHRISEMAFHLVNAAIVLHIRTVKVMANSRDNIDMFAFSIAQLIFSLLAFGCYLEIFFFAQGQRAVLKMVAQRDFRQRIVSFPFYLAAAIVSGINYYSEDGEDSTLATDDHRLLASDNYAVADTPAFVDHVPICLCIGGSLANFLFFVVVVQIWYNNDGSHKQYTVPIHVHFVIHRNGEWIMLMLGAGILNLLIVDVSDVRDYYATFYCGILTIVLLQYLHFRSQPHRPDDHAIRRNKDAGVWWSFVNGVYSASLLAVGVSYKLFVSEFGYATRRLEEERILASGEGAGLTTQERRQQIANLFGANLAIVWFCSDAIILLHLGLADSFCRCQCSTSKAINKKGVTLLALRACLIPFFASIGLWQTDPATLAGLGLAGVIVQLLLRRLGGMYFPRDYVHAARDHDGQEIFESDNTKLEIDPSEYAWPNVSHVPLKTNSDREDQEPDKPLVNRVDQEPDKSLVDRKGQEPDNPLVNRKDQESDKPLVDARGQEPDKPLVDTKGQEPDKPFTQKTHIVE